MIAAALVFALQTSTPVGSPTLADVLSRMGAYVVDFQSQLAGLVTEEKYVQTVQSLQTVSGGRFLAPAPDRGRVLVSDYLLVKPIGSSRWIEFRDVFELDGKPVRDRSERLARLFLDPTGSIADQVAQITRESSRYNLGGVVRTVNVPLLPLRFLDPASQPGFKFTRAKAGAPPLPMADVPVDLWVVEYEEVQKDTFIRTRNNRNLPAHGRVWVEAATGRVRATELTTRDAELDARIVVNYRVEPSIGLLVPSEMRERYTPVRGSGTVTGVATYSRVRRFTVTVDEKLEPVKK